MMLSMRKITCVAAFAVAPLVLFGCHQKQPGGGAQADEGRGGNDELDPDCDQTAAKFKQHIRERWFGAHCMDCGGCWDGQTKDNFKYDEDFVSAVWEAIKKHLRAQNKPCTENNLRRAIEEFWNCEVKGKSYWSDKDYERSFNIRVFPATMAIKAVIKWYCECCNYDGCDVEKLFEELVGRLIGKLGKEAVGDALKAWRADEYCESEKVFKIPKLVEEEIRDLLTEKHDCDVETSCPERICDKE